MLAHHHDVARVFRARAALAIVSSISTLECVLIDEVIAGAQVIFPDCVFDPVAIWTSDKRCNRDQK
jgi:hypothetical protein